MVTATRNQTCVVCGTVFDAPAHAGDYGLCELHWSRDLLREIDRIASARRHLPPGTPDSLKLTDWLAIVTRYNGLCAWCGVVPFSSIALLNESGLTASNSLPACRACYHHHIHGWEQAINRLYSTSEQSTMIDETLPIMHSEI